MKMNRKGSFDDLFLILIIAFVFAITILTSMLVIGKVNDMYQASDSIPQAGKDIISNANTDYKTLFDGTFLTIFLTLAIGSMVLASQVDVHPMFFPLSIIIYIILIIVSAVFGNAYYNIASNSEIAVYAEQLTIMPFVFNNLVQIMLGIGALLGIVLYSKTAGG